MPRKSCSRRSRTSRPEKRGKHRFRASVQPGRRGCPRAVSRVPEQRCPGESRVAASAAEDLLGVRPRGRRRPQGSLSRWPAPGRRLGGQRGLHVHADWCLRRSRPSSLQLPARSRVCLWRLSHDRGRALQRSRGLRRRLRAGILRGRRSVPSAAAEGPPDRLPAVGDGRPSSQRRRPTTSTHRSRLLR